LTPCPLRGRNCCRPRNAGHRIFVGHPPRRRAKRQVKCILLQIRLSGRPSGSTSPLLPPEANQGRLILDDEYWLPFPTRGSHCRATRRGPCRR
jgi:hypothetical protein